MFPFFPIPEDGETVYSCLCRCATRSGLPDIHVISHFTGQRKSSRLLSPFGGYLSKISAAVPNGHPWQHPRLMATQHTVLSYYVYFMSETERKQWVERVAETDEVQRVEIALGLSRYPKALSRRQIKWCPTCAKGDRQRVGFSYFHREHQMPGVAVCWIHGDILSGGCSVCGDYPIKGSPLLMPGKCNCEEIKPSLAIPCGPEHSEHFQWIARESAWVVSGTGTPRSNVRSDLRKMLIDLGYSKGSLIDYGKLAGALEQRFSSSFLDLIGKPVWEEGRPTAWLRKMFDNDGQKKVQTLQTMLLIGAAFDSIEAFEAGRTQRPANSVEALPPAVKKEPLSVTVADVHKVVATMAEKGMSLDTAAKYHTLSRKDLVAVARQHQVRIPLAARFTSLLGEQNLDQVREMLRSGAPKIFILDSYPCGEYGLTLIELDDPSLNRIHYEAARMRTRDDNRDKVLAYIDKNPGCSRTDIQQNLVGSYEYMLSHDKDWFYQQFPERKERQKPLETKKRRPADLDRDKALELKKLFDDTFSAHGIPVRLSATAALKRVGIFGMFCMDNSQFPLVKEALERGVEKTDSYQERKIRWGVAEMGKSRTPISTNKLRRVVKLTGRVVAEHKNAVVDEATKLGISIEARSVFAKVKIA